MNSEKIISLSFNKNQSHFACCTTAGVRIFNVKPLSARQLLRTGGALSCTIMNQPHMFAIIPSEKHSRYCGKTVLIYNFLLRQFVMEIACESGVQSVRTNNSKIIVVSMEKISIFSCPGAISHIVNMKTCPNPMGLCEITPSGTSTRQILAHPGVEIGSIHIVDISNLELTRFSAPKIIKAHSGEIFCLAINQLGTNVASASSKGGCIRIWDTFNRTKVSELIRTDKAKVYSINFSPDSAYICCSSVKGTIEIFSVKRYSLILLSNPLASRCLGIHCYPEMGIATFTVPPEVGCICTFLPLNTVAVAYRTFVTAICLDGSYYTYEFSTDGHVNKKAHRVYFSTRLRN